MERRAVAVFLLVFLCRGVFASVPSGISPNIVYSNTRKTTPGSAFKLNLDVVLGFLFKTVPRNDSASYGFGKYPDTVFGYCECYNMSQGDCGQCFNIARDGIDEAAPLTVGAQYWVNSSSYRCYLRFENYNFIPGYELPGDLSPAVTPVAIPPEIPEARKGSSSRTGVIVGVTAGAVAALAAAVGVLVFCFRTKSRRNRHLDDQSSSLRQHGEFGDSFEGRSLTFDYEELKLATKEFGEQNKLGQGGFGPVYKGVLTDGSEVAVKKLSLHSSQGNQEFVNEVNIITGIQHRNLTRLRGYSVKGDERLLVYEYLPNGSLDRAFDNSNGKIVLDWPTRYNIAIGVARGLAYLHEESQIQIIHRDIKASNILLDKDLTPKISDFGISKLFDQDRTSVDTKIAGTYGYMAPEYAMGGRLTVKADVFSFGVLLLEIICGMKCRDPRLSPNYDGILEWLWSFHPGGNVEEIVDKELLRSKNYSQTEALRSIHIALLCTHEDEASRPSMSEVVAMFLGYLKLAPLPTKSPWYFGLRNLKLLDHSSNTGGSSNTAETFRTETSSQ
ncbi:putative receptor-like protein kinase At4g00960 [Selaginella moellendorffii]|nr:putative receptor-like protein kinase At4g00960 [Selaginella moellendorffii]XP_024522085.1 putative receptor-like protein kinase At4g00960 [Selaginella moellendorffii]|eukprot:XP_002992698.2 putative receptor-like protein kinase At4g00960 [Selaginella moellendorffii]